MFASPFSRHFFFHSSPSGGISCVVRRVVKLLFRFGTVPQSPQLWDADKPWSIHTRRARIRVSAGAEGKWLLPRDASTTLQVLTRASGSYHFKNESTFSSPGLDEADKPNQSRSRWILTREVFRRFSLSYKWGRPENFHLSPCTNIKLWAPGTEWSLSDLTGQGTRGHCTPNLLGTAGELTL